METPRDWEEIANVAEYIFKHVAELRRLDYFCEPHQLKPLKLVQRRTKRAGAYELVVTN